MIPSSRRTSSKRARLEQSMVPGTRDATEEYTMQMPPMICPTISKTPPFNSTGFFLTPDATSRSEQRKPVDWIDLLDGSENEVIDAKRDVQEGSFVLFAFKRFQAKRVLRCGRRLSMIHERPARAGLRYCSCRRFSVLFTSDSRFNVGLFTPKNKSCE